MKTQKRNVVLTKKPFKRGYDMLPGKFQTPIRIKLMELCGWSTYATFLNKKFGKVPIRPPEIIIIEQAFKVYNLDPWSGEYLTP